MATLHLSFNYISGRNQLFYDQNSLKLNSESRILNKKAAVHLFQQLYLSKGQLIWKGLFGILEFFQKTCL